MERSPAAVSIALSVFCLTFIMLAPVPPSYSDQPSYAMPSPIDPSAKYFIFLHNYYVEKNGPEGDCRYDDILKAFADRGFIVISEIRTGKIVPCTYAEKVAREVRTLISSGVPPQNITVGGHSKGGVIGLCVAAKLENPQVNFVIMAGCGIASVEKFKMYPDFSKLKGRILSIYAASDSVANSCEASFVQASDELSDMEVKLTSDKGHRLFFTPEQIWLEPVIKWINAA
jgi:hypothetical protein